MGCKRFSSTKQTHILATRFAPLVRAESAPQAPSPTLPAPVVQDRLSRKAHFLAWRQAPTETRCKFYQTCLGATLFICLPPHKHPRWSAEEGCVRLAHASPGTRTQLAGLDSPQRSLGKTQTLITFWVPLSAPTPVLGTSSPVVSTDGVNPVRGTWLGCFSAVPSVWGHGNSHVSRHCLLFNPQVLKCFSTSKKILKKRKKPHTKLPL